MYKLLVFLILVYLFFRIFSRFIFPWLLKIYLERLLKKKFNFDPNMKNADNYKNEDVKIDMNTSNKSEKFQGEGEYVDFTEIKDDN